MNHLFCKSCESQYTESQKPFLLPCGHNLCSTCISKRIYSNRCFFCPFDSTFLKVDNCKLNLTLLKQSMKHLKNPEKTPKKKEKFSVPKIQTPAKSVHFLEPPKGHLANHNETVESVNTEYLYPCASEKKILKKSLEHSPNSVPCERSFASSRKVIRPQEKCRKKSRKPKGTESSSFTAENVAFVAASVFGGAFLLSKFSPSKPAVASGFMNTVKETSSMAIKGFFKLVKRSE